MYKDFEPKRGMFGLSVKWLIFGFGLLIILGALAFGASWLLKPAEIFDPSAIQARSREANDAWQALQAQLANIETARSDARNLDEVNGSDRATWPQGDKERWLQLEAQVSNLTKAYNGSCAQYNAIWQDEWRAVQAPPDLPTRCDLLK